MISSRRITYYLVLVFCNHWAKQGGNGDMRKWTDLRGLVLLPLETLVYVFEGSDV